jgi:hypothetical protein
MFGSQPVHAVASSWCRYANPDDREEDGVVDEFGNSRHSDVGRQGPAVHRTVLVVDVEHFGAHDRTNPHRIEVRDGLYRALEGAFARVGITFADCHREVVGDGVLVLVPADVAKSVFVERLPRTLAAAIREHNDTHDDGARIRLRMAIHAGEVHYDNYGVVGVAVNYAHRLINSPALKEALAASSGTMALVASDWFFSEVVRHSPDSDPGAYRRIRVTEKETDTVAWLHLPDEPANQVPPRARRDNGAAKALSPDALWAASERSVRRLGARRTAYPLDLSIAELHNRGLYVPATFSTLDRNAAAVDVAHLADQVHSGSSVLILGEPGSGKSVASYALLTSLRQHTPAIAARASTLRAALEYPAPTTGLGNASRGAWPGDEIRPVLVVDGLDETLGEFESSADLSELLAQLSERFSIIVTCRRREFEDNLAASVDSGAFDAIYSIDTWTLHEQFTEFVGRLVTAGLLGSAELLDVIARSPDLARMIVRPLYARMLTFLGQEGLPAVTNVSSLYAEYIDKLAVASDAALAGAGCRMRVRSGEIWTDAAWHIFCGGLLTEDRFDFQPVTAHLEDTFDERAQCLSRALSQICDQWRSGGRVRGRFVHYSFFEYLVSRYYVERLHDSAPATTEVLTECLSVDPSPEIRHFLVAELREHQASDMVDSLVHTYLQMRATAARTTRARTMCNLIAYLLSRAAKNGREPLHRLLEDEDDMFLRQSLLWGLCHLGDRDALARFVREGRRSAEWRAWNRGYVMYYYGDIDRRVPPPYDDDGRRGWGRTRERTTAMMSEPGYPRTVAPQRRFLDLYLLYDYAISREETLSTEDARVAAAMLDTLWHEPTIEGSFLQELQAMHAVACPA